MIYDPAVLRLIGYFFIVFILLGVLRQIPGIGAIFRVPLLGFYLTAILVSVLVARGAAAAVDRTRCKRLQRELGAVDTPHNRGKLGSLLLKQGRNRVAVGHLDAAVAGEPESAEWHYRLGLARLGSRDATGAIGNFETCLRLKSDHAYGAVRLKLAQAWMAVGDPTSALKAAQDYERLYGPSAESAYRRGLAHRAAGEKEFAASALAEVSQLAGQAVQYQRSEARGFVLKALFARLF